MLSFEYSHPCEPVVIALSDAMPRYDERFRGRNENKVEQLAHMAAWGFEWRLLPAHFVVHLPHKASQPDPAWDTTATPQALTAILLQEVEWEPEFRQHVGLDVPLPLLREEYRSKLRKRKRASV